MWTVRPLRSALPVARRRRGFTLVEIMIVVVIIGLLAALAIPAFARVKQRAQNSRVANDLRVFAQAFDTYLMENGAWPADAAPGVVPTELVGRLPAAWSKPTPIGGLYEWDNEPALKSLTLYQTTAPMTQMLAIDALIDDGNSATGNLQFNGTEWHYLLQQ
jgi:type IV pilus assembly protein PilA